MSDSVRPHRRQPIRLPRPWDSPGKNTGMGCHFLLQCMKVKMKVKLLSHVRLLETSWTAAHQAPPSMGFSRQEYWSGLPLPSPVIWDIINSIFLIYPNFSCLLESIPSLEPLHFVFPFITTPAVEIFLGAFFPGNFFFNYFIRILHTS